MTNKIHLPRLAIVITTRCNLRCKLCSVGVPTQKEVYHIDWEAFKQELAALFSVVDTVGSLEFAGGEPFLHADLPRMIELFMRYKSRFQQWLIVTNGTIQPSDNLIDILKKNKDKGIVHLSDYNIYPERTQQLVQLLNEIGYRYRVDTYYGDEQYQDGWVDPGAMGARGRSEEELRYVFSHCGIVKNGGCWRLYRGKVHLCTRSTRCTDAGFDFPQDYVDLLDTATSAEEKAEQLLSLLSTSYISACDYCNGDLGTMDKSKRFPAAEQLK